MKMYCYKKCSTCKKAEKFLSDFDIAVEVIDYTEHPISKEDLEVFYKRSNLDIQKFFNTSGLVYRDLNLKDKLPEMTLDEKLTLLSENPMLVKRPLVVGKDFILLGFKEATWKEKLLK